MGCRAPALHAAFGAQLGHGGFHRPAHGDRAVGPSRRRRDRRQSAARALSAQPVAHESLQPLLAAVPERPLHRRRGDSGGARMRRGVVDPRVRAVPVLRSGGARDRAGRLREGGSPQDAALRASLPPLSRQPHRGGHRAGRGLSRVSSTNAASGCESTRSSKRFRSISIAKTPRSGDGPCGPKPYRDPASPEVARFAEENVERVEFFEYLQWNADQQLERASPAGNRSGIRRRHVSGPRDLDRPRGRRKLGEPGRVCRGRERRRAARRSQSEGPELGPAAAAARTAARHRLCAVHRDAAREHAALGCASHRSRDGPVPALLDTAGVLRRARRLRRAIRFRTFSASSRWKATATNAW